MKSIWQDIQLGFRMLGKKPMVTVIAVVTLALGIGATTADFHLSRPVPLSTRLCTRISTCSGAC